MIGSWLGRDAPRVPAFTAGERRDVSVAVRLNVAAGSYLLDVGLGNDDLSVIYFEQQVAHLAVGHRPGGSGLVDFAPELLNGG
jgi:hypothetical protein